MLLHGIAKELSESRDEHLVEFAPSSGYTDFDSTQLQPLSAASTAAPSRLASDEPTFPGITPAGVDIDIDQLGPPEDFMQIIGMEPEAAQDPRAVALDFNLDIDEPPPKAQFRPRKGPRG